MDGTVVQTPPRKRPRSSTPSSASSHNVNKRLRPDTPPSPSPKTVRFNPINPEEDEEDAVLESDVPESSIVPSSKLPAAFSVTFAPDTPITEIDDPFAKLNIKTSAQKMHLATPIRLKINAEGSKSVKKSARKTPGSAKSNKAFRIKVYILQGSC